MKTMEDFKGTPGEFSAEYPFLNSDQLFITTPTPTVPKMYIAEVKAPETWLKVEAEANARLFANSKNVLEAAIEVVNGFQGDPGSLNHKIHALEKAINDSL